MAVRCASCRASEVPPAETKPGNLRERLPYPTDCCSTGLAHVLTPSGMSRLPICVDRFMSTLLPDGRRPNNSVGCRTLVTAITITK